MTTVPAAAPKKSLARILVRLVAALFLLLILAFVILFFSLDSIVKAGVIRGSNNATSQETALNLAKVSLAGGTLQLAGLDLSNLKGYSQPNIITMKSCEVTVQSSSLFSSTVVIEEISIDGLEITLEQNGVKNNLAEIIDRIQKNTAAAGSGSTSSGKQLKITKLNLAGTKVHIRITSPIPGVDLPNFDFELPALTIADPTNPDGRPLKIADLVGKIVIQVAKEIIEDPRLPPGIRLNMKNVTQLVDGLRGQLDKGLKQFKGLDELTKLPGAATQGIDAATKGIQDATKNIGDLLNQKLPPK